MWLVITMSNSPPPHYLICLVVLIPQLHAAVWHSVSLSKRDTLIPTFATYCLLGSVLSKGLGS